MLSSLITSSFHYSFKLIFLKRKKKRKKGKVVINEFVNECEMYVLHCVFFMTQFYRLGSAVKQMLCEVACFYK